MFGNIAPLTKLSYMKKFFFIACFAMALVSMFTACKQKADAASNIALKPSTDSTAAVDSTKKYTIAMVANKYDPSCRMPLTAGLEDTVHYQGKTYGFCSKECKSEFLRNPKGYVAKMR